MSTFVDTVGRGFRWNVKQGKEKARVETKVYMTTKVDSGNKYGVPEILVPEILKVDSGVTAPVSRMP